MVLTWPIYKSSWGSGHFGIANYVVHRQCLCSYIMYSVVISLHSTYWYAMLDPSSTTILHLFFAVFGSSGLAGIGGSSGRSVGRGEFATGGGGGCWMSCTPGIGGGASGVTAREKSMISSTKPFLSSTKRKRKRTISKVIIMYHCKTNYHPISQWSGRWARLFVLVLAT